MCVTEKGHCNVTQDIWHTLGGDNVSKFYMAHDMQYSTCNTWHFGVSYKYLFYRFKGKISVDEIMNYWIAKVFIGQPFLFIIVPIHTIFLFSHIPRTKVWFFPSRLSFLGFHIIFSSYFFLYFCMYIMHYLLDTQY